MRIQRLDIQHLRNLQPLSLRGLRTINVFYGENGSGKTSLLEGIYLLAMGRSFRTARFSNAVQQGCEATTAYAEFISNAENHTLGVQRGGDGPPELRFDGARARTLAELASRLPVQLINAQSFELLDGSPAQRRQFMDWGVFHVEHSFNAAWQRAKKCLKQRNSLLRQQLRQDPRHGKINDSQLDVWDREFAQAAVDVDTLRRAYVETLSGVFYPLLEAMNPSIADVQLGYRRGWNKDVELLELLQNQRSNDLKSGFTSIGPHRADISIRSKGMLAKDALSRGQEKIVVCALKLAQAQVLLQMNGAGGNANGSGGKPVSGKERRCIFLVDDLPTELDAVHRQKLCTELEKLGAQVFITCIEPEAVQTLWADPEELAMFHVEHGNVIPDLRGASDL